MEWHHVINIIIELTKLYGPYVGIVGSLSVIAWKKRQWLCDTIKTIRGITNVKKNIETTVEGALFSIMFKINADRVFVFEYTDYDERQKPLPFGYADNTFEVLNPSVSVKAQKHKLQRVPLSSVPFWAQGLSQDGQVCLYDIENIRHTDPTTYEILNSQSIKSCYAVNLIDFRGTALGFVGVDYCQDHTELDKKDFKSLRCEAFKIAGLLILKRNGTLRKHAYPTQKEVNKQKYLPFK